MKPFNRFLAPRLEEFITYRENLGLRCTIFRSYLLHFDNYIKEQIADWADFTPPFSLHFQKKIPGENSTVNKVISAVHSMRHSYAVNTLKSIKVRGDDPQKALPVLSAYMGHHKYCYTAQYLNTTATHNFIDKALQF